MKTLLFIISIFFTTLLSSQTNVLVVYMTTTGSTDGAFPCVRNYAGLDGNFTLCPMSRGSLVSAPTCFTGLSSYDMIMVQAQHTSLDAAFMTQLVNYIQGGGSLYFQIDCGGGVRRTESRQNINDLLAAIGQPNISLSCNSHITWNETPTFGGTAAACGTSSPLDYITGGFLSGPVLSNAVLTSSVGAGTYQAFWPTGFGGILGIGSESTSSGNWAGYCSPSSSGNAAGANTWNGMLSNIKGCDINAQFAMSDSNICAGECIDLMDESTASPTATTIVDWDWTINGGTPSSSDIQNPSSICFNSSGTYDITLTVTDDLGNTDDTTMQIVIASVSAQIVGDSCSGPAQLNAVATGFPSSLDTFQYEWTPAGSLNNPFIQNPIATPSGDQSYIVTVTRGSCEAKDTVFLPVCPALNISFLSAELNTSQEGNPELKWSLSESYDSPGAYSILRAREAGNFKEIAFIPFGSDSYRYEDFYANEQTKYYYKIKAEINGEIVKSAVLEWNGNRENIKVYPNPATDLLFVNTSTMGESILELYSVNGKLIHSYSLNAGDNQINIEGIKPGLYFYRISGSALFSGKIMKD